MPGTSTEVGSIHYELDLDDKKFKSGMSGASNDVQGFKGHLEKAEGASKAFALGITAISAGLVAFGVKSVQAYNESETAMAQQTAVLNSTKNVAGQTAEELNKVSQELLNMSGVSDEAVTAGQNMLLTFTNIRGDVFPDTTKTLLDMATAMNGGVVPSAEQMRTQAIQLGKALNDPTDGVTKLTRVGVTFTEQQKKQIETLQANGDIMGAQRIMLAELNTEFGGSAKMAGSTFTGQLNILKESFGNLMEVIGEGIVKSLKPLVEGFNNWFASVGGAEGVMQILTDFMTKVKDNLPIIVGIIIGGLTPAFYGLAVGIWTALAPLLPFIAVGALLGLGIKALIDHFGGLQGTLTALKPIIDTMVLIWDAMLKPALMGVWDVIANQLWPALKNLWETIAPVLIPVLKVLGAILGLAIVGAIMLAIGAIKVIIWYITEWVKVFTWIVDKIKDVISWFYKLATSPGEALKDAGQAIINAFSKAFDWLKDKFKEAKDWMNELNPFTRHSPSLIDNIVRGVGIIKSQYGSLNDINLMPVSQLAPDYREAGSTSVNNNSTIIFNGDINNTENRTLDDIGGRINGQLTQIRLGA